MGWRQKLTIDWPCAVGDWLWQICVVEAAEYCETLTLKRAMMIAGMLLLIVAFAQVFTIDLAIIFAGDAMTWFEVVTAVTLIVARGHAAHGWRIVVHRTQAAITRFHHFTAVGRRPRTPHHQRSILRRLMARLLPPDDEDRGAGNRAFHEATLAFA